MAKKIKNKVLRGIHEGIYTPERLPVELYHYNAGKLMAGVRKGFARTTFEYNSPDWKLYEAIGDNVYTFAGSKVFQETLKMSQLLDKDGKRVSFDEFATKAGTVYDEYNETWLEAEYETAIDSARMGAKWNEFQELKDEMPYLTFVTEEDETVCDECDPLDNFTAHIDDPFWSKNYPPLHFRCHCDVQQTDEPGSMAASVRERIMNKISKENRFKNNVGKTGIVFVRSCPYFSIPAKYKHLAEHNFNLPVPFSHHKIMNIVGRTEEEKERAKKVDLILLPNAINGTNCGNCMYIKNQNYCINKKVDQPVTPRMCCALWDAKGVKRVHTL